MKRGLLICAGACSLSLGVVGIFVPVLPTTPFLLLSATCFLNSSTRLYRWLVGHRILGKYIENYLKYRAVTVRAKILSLVFLWATILSTIVFFTGSTPLRLFLTAVAVAVSVHLLRLRTLPRRPRGDS